MPKVMLMALGGVLAIALAARAPLESASPSTAAERIVGAHNSNKKPGGIRWPEPHRAPAERR
jgi:hypothetical protein